MKHNDGMLIHKRWIGALVLVVMLMMAVTPALAANTGIIKNPNGELVNMRAWGSMDAPVLCTLYVGTKVEITGAEGAWYTVWVNGVCGYIHQSLVSTSHGESAKQTAVINRDTYLRQTASKDACVLAYLSYGTKVTVISTGKTWTQVSYGSCTGYVLTERLGFASVTPAPEPPKDKPSPVKPPVATQNSNATIRTFNGGNVNLRAWTSTSADVIGSFASGTRVHILTHGETWCKVQIGYQVGYMVSKYLVFDGGNPHFGGNNANNGSQYATIYSAVNLRKEPNVNSRSLGTYYNGASVQLLGVGTEWVRVQVNGVSGYMKAEYVKTPASATPHKTVVNNGSYVNLREGAGYDYRVLKQVPHGSAATVVVPYAIWSKVIVKDGQGYLSGYMMNNFLK